MAQFTHPAVSREHLDASRDRLGEALAQAAAAGCRVPPELRTFVVEYARETCLAGGHVGAFLVDVKRLVRSRTGDVEPIFMPKVIGWAVQGYFESTSPGKPGAPG